MESNKHRRAETLTSNDLISCSLALANLLRMHRGKIVVYTGAGISTAANIPDYRGTNGLWTKPTKDIENAQSSRMAASKTLRTGAFELRLPEATFARPTFTHMAISALVAAGYIRHVVSQNVDGLHIRSGVPREKLSEMHGNLFIEQCIACNTIIYRAFDVAETTYKGRHLTGRICPLCREQSTDGLVHLEARLASKAAGDLGVQTRKLAAERLLREHSKKRKLSPLPPLLRDVIVHYRERQPSAGLADIYRTQSAFNALIGEPTRPAIQCDEETASSLSNAISDSEIRNKEAASLILVFGSSLAVLKHYSFLWPSGLGRCRHDTKRRRLGKQQKNCALGQGQISEKSTPSCQLAIVNLQPTCKDSVANLVCRLPCDMLMRQVMEQHLRIPVLQYLPDNDQLLQWAIPLPQNELLTRTRVDIASSALPSTAHELHSRHKNRSL